MLIQITFIILMLFGVAALTIDLGLTRLAQTEMQAAADMAALEGARAGGGDPAAADVAARAAGMMAQQVPAGPNVVLANGVDGDLNASQTIAAGGQYYASLQPNAGNAPYGDVVNGSYQATAGGDLSASAANMVTSASHMFRAMDIGRNISVTGGTGWAAGTYQITSVSAVTGATLSGSACATVPCSGGLWSESGPLSNSDYDPASTSTPQRAGRIW